MPSGGTALFSGQRFTAITGDREFAVTDAQRRAFAEVLLSLLPETGIARYQPGEPKCPSAPTDMPSVQVRMAEPLGERGIDFYYGCSSSNPAVAERLRRAPTLLLITDLIGRR